MAKRRRTPQKQGEARTTLPDPRRTPRYAGIVTFCRLPRIEDVPGHQRPVDWALYGVPFDGGVTYRPGARFGPRAIRNESQYVKLSHLEHGISLPHVFSMADAGDSPIQPFDLQANVETVADFALELGDAKHTKLLAIGGDHSIACANIKATWQRRGSPKRGLALLHFDAHLDTVDVIAGSKWTHGSPFRRLIEDGFIDSRRMLSIGLRGPLNHLSDLDYARDQGVQMITMDDWHRGNGRSRVAAFLKRRGNDETYLSFDIDCIDPAFAPGTGTPTSGGFTADEAMSILRQCAGANIVGADVVEVLPDRDSSGITALLASHIMVEILALAAMHRTRG